MTNHHLWVAYLRPIFCLYANIGFFGDAWCGSKCLFFHGTAVTLQRQYYFFSKAVLLLCKGNTSSGGWIFTNLAKEIHKNVCFFVKIYPKTIIQDMPLALRIAYWYQSNRSRIIQFVNGLFDKISWPLVGSLASSPLWLHLGMVARAGLHNSPRARIITETRLECPCSATNGV